MANLIIDVDFSVETENLRITKDFEEVKLDKKEGEEFFSNINADEIKFEVISTNDDADASFSFGIEDGKKGAIMKVEPLASAAGLQLHTKGEFSVKLRKGADAMLKNLGPNLDLRLRAVTWKGGSYMGFAAPLRSGDYEQESDGWRDSFPKIEKFLIK
jgi:hypothetical protein